MLQNKSLKPLIAIALLLLCMPMLTMAEPDDEHKRLYREFVRLQNFGKPDEFHAHAAKYEQWLKDQGKRMEYYKIKTSEGFYDVAHNDPFHAWMTVWQLGYELHTAHDSAYYYLGTGLRADILKLSRDPQANSVYQQALAEVGDRDPKFRMLMHMGLGQVNYMTNPEKALEWAAKAQHAADSLNNTEYKSMAIGLKGYLYFMLAKKAEFEQAMEEYSALKSQFETLDPEIITLGKQQFSHRYDTVLQVARHAFDGDFKTAFQLAKSEHLNVDRQVVTYRLFGMEGQAEKEKAFLRLTWGFVFMTILYFFIYFMGRRRLLRKIQQRKAQLLVAMEKADEANRMKAAFIRSMSHEIRTPLNAVNGFSQIICSSDYVLSEQEKKDIRQRITSNAEAITIIINELLELAAGESVTLDDTNLTDVSPNEVCQAAMTNAEQHNTNGLELSFTTELSNDFTIKSNDETIKHILDKIIDNALKFTSEGSINLHASLQDGMVRLCVTDTGIGIPEAHQLDVFDNFVKLDDYKGGVGLGLPICKRLAHSLGGDVILDKSYTEGSRFIVLLPVR